MKIKITLSLVLTALFFFCKAQQIQNGGFETWTSASTPTGWATLESAITPIAGTGLTVKDSIDKAQGNSSIKLTSKYVSLANDTVPGMVAIGTGDFANSQPNFYGTPFTYKPDTLFFSFKYEPTGNDSAGVLLDLHKLNGGPGNYIAQVFAPLTSTGGQWITGSVVIDGHYNDTLSACDTMDLRFMSTLRKGNAPVGSILHVDAVRLGYKSAPSLIENIKDDVTVSVFPNPAQNLINIAVNVPLNGVSIMVFDLTGRVITHEFISGSDYQMNTSRWESGIYSYSLLSNGVVVNKGRIVIQK